MIVTRMALPRRTFLRGVGATLALPLLDAMVPALTAVARTAANPVRRLGFVYIPMGSIISEWTPKSLWVRPKSALRCFRRCRRCSRACAGANGTRGVFSAST